MSPIKGGIKLGAFLSGSGTQGDSWRHPRADTGAYKDFSYYARYAQILERGRFDALFFYDNVVSADNTALWAANPGVPRWDPLILLAALAVVTKHIGLIATASTSYNEPYNLARKFASIDHLSGGRAGWNVVTSTGGGQNFNRDDHLDHAFRYERAQEFYDVVTGLWDSTADDVVLADKQSGLWLDPSRLRRLDHKGKHFSVRGPLNAPRPIQGYPVIAQSGGSDAGRALAARIGELIYTAEYDIGEGIAFAEDVRSQALQYGRDPSHIKICPGVSPFVGRTDAEARKKFEEWQSYRDLESTLRGLSNYASLGFDLSKLPLDAPVQLPDILPETNSHKSRQSVLASWIRKTRPTVREIAQKLTAGGHRIVVGSPQTIADDFEHWYRTGAADGFNIMFPSAPEGIEDFVDLVIPELQRRGLFRTEYEGRTFRENLGVPLVPNRHFAVAAQ